MTAVLWWGYPRTTSGRLYVRPDADGVLSAVCNGKTYTGSACVLADGADRVGHVDITDLAPDSRSDVAIYLDGVMIDTASVRTAPLSGRAFRVVIISCQYTKQPWLWDAIIQSLDPVLVIVLGDGPYIEQPDTAASGATGTVLNAFEESVQGISSVARTDEDRKQCYWAHHRQFYRQLRGTLRRYPMIQIKSDHAYAANDWNRTLANGNAYSATMFADLAELDHYNEMVDAWLRPYYQGNPPNASAGRDLSRAPDAQLYFSLGIGNLRIFCTEHYTYQNRGGESPRYQLGPTQEQWLYDEAASTIEPLKVWACSPGAPWLSGADEERDRIFGVVGNSHAYGWARPGGWANVHGDIHVPYAQYDALAKGAARTLLRVNASPCGTGQNLSWGPAAAGENTVWSPIAGAGSTPGFFWTICEALVDGRGRWMDLSLLDLANPRATGRRRFGRRIYAGSNVAHRIPAE